MMGLPLSVAGDEAGRLGGNAGLNREAGGLQILLKKRRTFLLVIPKLRIGPDFLRGLDVLGAMLIHQFDELLVSVLLGCQIDRENHGEGQGERKKCAHALHCA